MSCCGLGSAVAPFAGAETGTGGRLRDVQATGRGAYTLAGIAGYCVGSLFTKDTTTIMECYPSNIAPPLMVLIEASNGASDYGMLLENTCNASYN